MLDIHTEALETSSGPYHEFLLMFRANKTTVYGFVEGKEDPSYYRGIIEAFLSDGWTVRLIRSGNRKAVLSILSTIPWERFTKKRICFFIDRDLSDFINEEPSDSVNLYTTDNYSIENDVVNSHVFGRVIEEIFGISDASQEEMEIICNEFANNLGVFCEALTPIMSQIIIWRREAAKAALANIKPQTLFIFSGGKIGIVSEYASPMARVGYAANCVGLPPSDEETLRVVEREFRDRSGLSRFVRGKYLLWLLVESAVALHKAIALYCPRYPVPPKLRVTMGAGNAMIIIGPRAKAPSSLKEFIMKSYVAYIDSVTRNVDLRNPGLRL